MKKQFCLYLITLTLVGFSLPQKIRAQDWMKEERTLPAFNQVVVKGGFDVTLEAGETCQVSVRSTYFPLQKIITKVNKKGQLVIKRKVNAYKMLKSAEDEFEMKGQVQLNLTYQNLQEIKNSGSGSITVKSPLQNVSVTIKQSGSGQILFKKLKSDYLEAKLSGSGEILVQKGEIQKQVTSLSGSGKIDLRQVLAQTSENRVSGSGKVYVQVQESLQAKITGSGHLYYAGSPSIRQIKVSGSGSEFKID